MPQVYQTFGLVWEDSYMRFAQQAITNVAQSFTPKQFWNDRRKLPPQGLPLPLAPALAFALPPRPLTPPVSAARSLRGRADAIEQAMLARVNQTISDNGYACVRNLQLLSVQFKQNYEDTITNIQLQEQLKVTKTYALEVTRVLKEVDILQSQTAADVAVIGASARREASVIVNQAEAEALRLEQSTKAHWYSSLKQRLSWSNADFLQYVKIKSLSSQPSNSMTVGVSAMGETS